MPQTAALYAGIGLAVNLRGIDFVDIAAFQTPAEGGEPARLVVEGDLVGVARERVTVPRSRSRCATSTASRSTRWSVPGPRAALEPGERARFKASLSARRPRGAASRCVSPRPGRLRRPKSAEPVRALAAAAPRAMLPCSTLFQRRPRASQVFKIRMSNASKRVRVLFDEATIAQRNDELAAEIVAAKPDNLLVVAVLKGSFMFAADLLRALHRAGLSPQVEFVHLSSYRTSTVSSGQVEILRDVQSEVRGRDVLLVDDILESGRTVVFAKDLLMARGARRVLTAVLLEKPGKRAVTIEADFVGFTCPDVFVVGYGMDAAHAFRQLPFVGLVDYESTDPDLFGGADAAPPVETDKSATLRP